MVDDMQDQKMRTTGDYWEMMRRQRWIILSSIFICWVVVWCIGWVLPSSYQSDAVVLVKQQIVSPTLVEPTLTVSLENQFENIRQQVMSRESLQNLIAVYKLYPKSHGISALFAPSDPVDQMASKDIQTKLVEAQTHGGNQESLAAFDISYSAPSPQLAQEVTQRLAELFVQDDIENRQQSSEVTTEFLKAQLEDAQADLNAKEAAVKAFKAQHVGELPDQLQGNLQILGGLQTQLQENEHALTEAREQRLYLESIVQQYQSAQSDLGGSDSAVAPSTLDKELKDLEMQLAQERSQYTDNYPDVIALKDQIAKTKELKKQAEQEAASQQHKADKGSDGLLTGSALDVQNGSPTPMMQIESQLKSNQLEMQSLENSEKKIEATIGRYQGQLDSAPMVEQQLDEISRGYLQASKNYDTLYQKLEDSQLTSNLQQNQQGEQFTILGSASLPTKPSAPNHLLISLGGLGAGVVIGLVLAGLIEFTDVRVRKESDLEGIVSARVLVGIPKLSTELENRQRAMFRWVERGTVLAMLVLVVAGNIYSFLKG
jgi:polysaccharide biosynthesis transport protein